MTSKCNLIIRSKSWFCRLIIFATVILASTTPLSSVSAVLSDEYLLPFSQNDIMFYDPEECVDDATTSSGNATASGDTIKKKVWSSLKSLNLSDELTAGIMGNMQGESNFNPATYEWSFSSSWAGGLTADYKSKTDGFDYDNDYDYNNISTSRGIGLTGFSFGLRVGVWDYVRQHNADLADKLFGHPEIYGKIGSEDAFIKKALENGLTQSDIDTFVALQVSYLVEEVLNGPTAVSMGYDKILNSTTIEESAQNFAVYYERCAGCANANTSAVQTRTNYAKNIYEEFKGQTNFGSGTSVTTPTSISGENITLIGDSINVILQALGGGTSVNNGDSADDECCNETSNTLGNIGEIYPGTKYAFSDAEIRRIAYMASNENGGSVAAIQAEASLMANLFEKNRGPAGDTAGLISYITTCPPAGWFSTCNEYYNGDGYNNQEYIDAVKDVLVNGNRTVPPQVVEHDCFYPECSAGIGSISNDGGNTWTAVPSHADASQMLDQFKRGETILKQAGRGLSGQYIFWDWADPENHSGDPFGYFANNPPAESSVQSTKGTSATTAAGSSVTWTDDGWISGGINGYSKMELSSSGDSAMFGADYVTSSPNGKNPGPNKITLHAFEGPGGNEGLIKGTYESGFPPQFTIDIKNRKIYQHMSIWKAGAAIQGTTYGDLSAGVQIEIMGYDNSHESGYSSEWDLANSESFSADDWQYLAELLNAISVETGIPLTSTVDWSTTNPARLNGEEFKSYQGILSHKHTPSPNDHSDLEDPKIWEYIQAALANFSGSQQISTCSTSSEVDVAALQNLVKEWVWKKDESGWNTTQKKPAYNTVIERRKQDGKYVGSNGIDCGGFVTTLMQESGWDPDYNTNPSGNTTRQREYLQSSPKWDEVTSTIHSNSDAKPGDVLIKDYEEGNAAGDGWHHTLVYIGKVEGFNYSEMAEAGQDIYAPSEGKLVDIMYWVNQGFHVFRNNQPPMTNGGAISESGLTYDQAKTLMRKYGKNENNDSYNTMMASPYGTPATGCTGGALSNCVSFTAFFLNKFTSSQHPGGNGYEIVGNLSRYGVSTDSTPSVWSVFSYGGPSGANHTGIILGYRDGEWIIGQAGCRNKGTGEGDGTYEGGGAGVAVKSSDINTATWNSTGASITYAHPSVDTSKISSYINGG